MPRLDRRVHPHRRACGPLRCPNGRNFLLTDDISPPFLLVICEPTGFELSGVELTNEICYSKVVWLICAWCC